MKLQGTQPVSAYVVTDYVSKICFPCQVILPHKTESYCTMSDPCELMKPGAGTKFFYKIEHTLKWASMLFEKEFIYDVERAKEYLLDPGGFLEKFSVRNRSDAVSYLSYVARKPVFGVSNRVRHKPSCITTV